MQNKPPAWSADSPGFPIVPVLILVAFLAGAAWFVGFGGAQRLARLIAPSTPTPVSIRVVSRKQKLPCNAQATAVTAVSPDYPESAAELGLGPVTVLTSVTIGPKGTVRRASILTSSGNKAIDQATIRAATESTYTPRMIRCHPVSGTYIFRADFSPR